MSFHNHVHDEACEHHDHGPPDGHSHSPHEDGRDHSHHHHGPTAPQKDPVVRFEQVESDFDRCCVAAGQGRLEDVKEMIQSGSVQIDGFDNNGNTLLHFAATQDRDEMCEYLLSKCPELLDVRNKENGHTAVHWAASAGALLCIHVFFKSNPQSLHVKDDSGLSTMHMAAQNDKVEAMHYLAAKGIDVSVRDNQGNTPLHWAAIKASEQAMRYLVASGVDLAAQNQLGLTPLHYGAGLNHLVVIRNMSIHGEQHKRPFSELEAIRDNQNRTTRDVAESKGETHKHMVRLIDNNLQREKNSKRLARWFPFLATKRNQNIFLFFTPFMVCLSIIFLFQGRFVYGIGVAAIIGVLYPMLGHTLRDDPLASGPILASIFHLTCLFSFFALQSGLPPEWKSSKWSSIVSFMSLMLSVTQLVAMFSNPNAGPLPDQAEDCQRWIEDIDQHRVAKICPTCRLRRALRSKHCREDDICVARFDHWCVWTFNSVGAGNHRAFMVMVVSVVIGSCSLLIFCASAFFGHLASESWAFFSVVMNYPTLFFAFILGCLHFPWTAFLFKAQLECILQNLTTNEAIHGVRIYDHFRGGTNPFDLGSKWRNLLDFLSGNSYDDVYYLSGKHGVLDSIKVD